METIGLSTYRWNNNIKSVLLFFAFPFALWAMVVAYYAVAGYQNLDGRDLIPASVTLHLGFYRPMVDVPLALFIRKNAISALPIVLCLATAWILIGVFFLSDIITYIAQARPVKREDNPRLYNLLENLCISRGLRMPRLYIINRASLNAFASGLTQRTFAITVTRGLIEELTDDELEAVLAHELTHIINLDVRLILFTILYGSIFGVLPEGVFNLTLYLETSDGYQGEGYLAKALPLAALIFLRTLFVALLIGYLVSLAFKLALSRKREYLADAGAIELTKRPDALISALRKIEGRADLPRMLGGVEALLIEQPSPIFSFLRTHPSVEDRIANIERVMHFSASERAKP